MARELLFKADVNGQAVNVYETDRTIERYADGFHGIAFDGNTVRINFFVRAWGPDNSQEQAREVTCRLIMPIPEFETTLAALTQALKQFRADTSGTAASH